MSVSSLSYGTRTKVILSTVKKNEFGGVTRVIQSLTQIFTDMGFEISFLWLDDAKTSSVAFEGEDIQALDKYSHTIAYRPLPVFWEKHPGKGDLHYGDAVGYLRRYLEDLDLSSTIFVFLQHWVLNVMVNAGLKIGGPEDALVFTAYHSSYDACVSLKHFDSLLKASYHSTRTLALTEGDRDKFANAGLTNMDFIYNAVELSSSPTIIPWNEREKTAVYVGRFGPEKQVPWIVSAWAQVSRDFPDWKLDIYGVGGQEQAIRDKVAELNLQESVSFMGLTNQPEKVFASARIMLMASDFEGLSMSIIEAMLCGTPVIAVNCSPGMEVLVKHDINGFLLPTRELGSYCDSMMRLMSNDDLGLSFSHSAISSADRFSIKSISDDWRAFFLENGVPIPSDKGI